ncbi:MAG TPA: RHS repeat-associated core domain-containing protein [Candidatus Brocadiaceae bacterium]
MGTWKGRVFTRGKKFFELSNHLGNVLVTITDRKQQVPKNDTLLKYYEPDVATANDYYPFGMLQPGRKYSSAGSGYRYGFNGKENDNDVKGEGNQQDYGMRIYDPRLGRFLSVDPISADYPELAPYQFASNRPIDGIDLDGKEFSKAKLEEILANAKAKLGTFATESAIVLHGTSNALVNANFVGVPDHLPSWLGGTNNLDDYSTDYDKSLYLYGRILGDVAAGLQSIVEMGTGGSMTAAGGGVTPVAWAGEATMAHALGVGIAAADDIGWALRKLAGLEGVIDNTKRMEQTPDEGTNNQTNSAHGKGSASQSNTGSSGSTEKAKDLKLLHKEETITKSAAYQKIKKMSDKELIESVTNPTQYNKVKVNTETGKLSDGNTRIYEIQRRGLDVDVPVEKYTPDNSHLPDLKEPPKKTK